MKHVFAFILAAAMCFAGDMVRVTGSDFKIADPEELKRFEHERPTFDLSKPEDRNSLESFESALYTDALMKLSWQYFRQTTLKPGDNWKALWVERQKAALDEVADETATQRSLKQALCKMGDFLNDVDATILERVVKAKFGGDDAWILLVHWERAAWIGERLAGGKEAAPEHFLIIAVRACDQKIVARAMCG